MTFSFYPKTAAGSAFAAPLAARRHLEKTLAGLCLAALVSIGAAPASADTLSRSVDVKGSPAAIWAKIGGFCAIRDWHPAIGTCTEDGKTPLTRTLVTKDGKATFVELETGSSADEHFYSYTFTSSPLPVEHYAATLKVTEKSADISTVTWSGSYTPVPGKEKAASEALAGIYESGLDSIRQMLGK